MFSGHYYRRFAAGLQDAAGGSCHRLTQFEQDVMNARKRSESVDPAFDIDEPEKRLYADTISSQTLSRRSTTMIESPAQVQAEFVHLLKQRGCSLPQTLAIASRLADPLNLADMLDYMADNPDSTPEQLYEVCSKISSKRPDPPDPEF